jgi:hypothetical protein
LTDDDDTAVRNRTIRFFVDGDRLCPDVAPTDEQGTTTCTVPNRYRSGKHDFEAVFLEDGRYQRAEDSRTT